MFVLAIYRRNVKVQWLFSGSSYCMFGPGIWFDGWFYINWSVVLKTTYEVFFLVFSFLVYVCVLFCSQLKAAVCAFTFPFTRPFISVLSLSASHIITWLCSHHCFDCTLCPDKCRLCPNIASVNMLYFTSACLVSFCAFVPENSCCAVGIFMFFSPWFLFCLQVLTLACFMDCGLVVCALLNY